MVNEYLLPSFVQLIRSGGFATVIVGACFSLGLALVDLQVSGGGWPQGLHLGNCSWAVGFGLVD